MVVVVSQATECSRRMRQQGSPLAVQVRDEYDAVGSGGERAPIRSRSLAFPPARPTAHSVTLVAFESAHERKNSSRRVGESRDLTLDVVRGVVDEVNTVPLVPKENARSPAPVPRPARPPCCHLFLDRPRPRGSSSRPGPRPRWARGWREATRARRPRARAAPRRLHRNGETTIRFPRRHPGRRRLAGDIRRVARSTTRGARELDVSSERPRGACLAARPVW